MHWLLAGCCGLALINISVALNPAELITQKPRFYGVKASRNVEIYCLIPGKVNTTRVQWYKAEEYDVDVKNRIEIKAEQKFYFNNRGLDPYAALFIYNVSLQESGVYYCKINNTTWGAGTALHVARNINVAEAQYRTKMKDGLMILQGLVLAVCIAAVLLRKRHLMEKRDSIYEEPDTDHIYEGLAIETCGGDLYEDLSVYAQPEGAEAPWE